VRVTALSPPIDVAKVGQLLTATSASRDRPIEIFNEAMATVQEAMQVNRVGRREPVQVTRGFARGLLRGCCCCPWTKKRRTT
jgi:hypothetical protein